MVSLSYGQALQPSPPTTISSQENAVTGLAPRTSWASNPAADQESQADGFAAERIALRFTWGGGTARRWQGKIGWQDSAGNRLTPWQKPRLLSIDKDAPGSVLVDPKQGFIRLRSIQPTSYNSFEVRVPLDPDAVLELEMVGDTEGASPVRASIKISDILEEGWNTALDQQGNGFWIERPSEDRLRFEGPGLTGIFQSGQERSIQLQGIRTGLRPGATLQWEIQLSLLTESGSDEPSWQDRGQVVIDAEGNFQTNNVRAFTVPQRPGVYQLDARVSDSRNAKLPFASTSILTRSFQFAVGSPGQTPQDFVNSVTRLSIKPEQLGTGWGHFPEVPRLGILPRMNGIPRLVTDEYISQGSEALRVEKEDSISWLELAPGHWRTIEIPGLTAGAYWLSLTMKDPGRGRLAVTVLQPDAAGNVSMLQAGAGVWEEPWLGQQSLKQDEKPQTWRQPVWINASETAKPIVIVLQNPGDEPIRLNEIQWEGWDLQQASSSSAIDTRSTSLYLQTPLLPTVFRATKFPNGQQETRLNDWQTLWSAVRRMNQLLGQRGTDLVWLPVFGQGGSLYPSDLSQTSLRYENSGFSTSLQSEAKIDVVAMVLSALQQDHRSLMPVMDFTGTLELVEQRSLEQGIPVPWSQGKLADGHYNILHPLVQQAISDLLVQFVHRYRGYDSLAGIGLVLGAESHLLLRSEHQGLEDLQLFQAFIEDRRLDWPVDQMGKIEQSSYEQRVQFVEGNNRGAWLKWRAQRLTDFYQELAAQMRAASGRPQWRVCLIAENWLQHPIIKPMTYPNLRNSVDWSQEALRVGVDLKAVNAETSGLEWKFQWAARPDIDLAQQRTSAFRFHSRPAWQIQQELNAASPLFQDALEVLDLSDVPVLGTKHAGLQSLVSYVQAGGRARAWSESLRMQDCQELHQQSWNSGVSFSPSENNFLSAFRSLPRTRFETVYENPHDSVVIRQASHSGQYWYYLVNAAPWPVTVTGAGPGEAQRAFPDSLHQTTTQFVSVLTDRCELPSYSLAVFRSSKPVDWSKIRVEDDPGVREALTTVEGRLFEKLKHGGDTQPWPYLENGDFEAGATMQGWTASQQPQQQIDIDSRHAHTGEQSLHVLNTKGVAWLRTHPLPPVTTGRVSVMAWIKMHPASASRQIRLSIDAETASGEKYYRFAEVELQTEQAVHSWQPIAAHFDDLPEQGLVHFRVGLDVMQPGEFWVDSVQCFDRWFDSNDQRVLSSRLGLLSYALESRPQNYGAYQILDDYWLNFLEQYSGDEQKRLATAPEADDPAGWSSRMKRRLFNLR